MNKPLNQKIIEHPVADRGCYKISFSAYMDKHCELQDLKKASYRKIVEWIKNACCSEITEKESIRSFKNGRLYPSRKDIIRNEDYYSFLFNNLDEDTTIYELDLPNSNRMFYYFDDDKMDIKIRLFKNSHLEAKKNKGK